MNTLDTITHKNCCICNEVKIRSEFGIDNQKSDGLNPRCRECRSELDSRALISKNILKRAETVIKALLTDLGRDEDLEETLKYIYKK